MRTIATYLIVQGFTAWNMWLSLTDARIDGSFIYLAFAVLVFVYSVFSAAGIGIGRLFAIYLAAAVVNTMLDFYWTGYNRVAEGVIVSASIGLAFLVPGLAGLLIRKFVCRRK